MKMRWLRIAAVLGLLVQVAGCADDEKTEVLSNVDDGVAVQSGGVTFALGDSRASIEAIEGVRLYELGALGTRFELPGSHVAGFLDATGVAVLTVYDDFAGITKGEVGLGSPLSAVVETYGEGVSDPFIQARSYPELGVGFIFDPSDLVIGIRVFAH
ncbi:MAG: hypothetical protein AUK47_10975 [Deltaproteobacteria bacterium CG2_30_63_29]|nr:MAG: hypothetical protein AUK47_10975 [Deltaproteobacteria bacterium CG2_30_63_29]PIV98177.1 MAG: hypothetical protein COW42_16165 [Deltaproteobacteria bacterium CG17_big_fil_post_rev_8_21_14_2_50_63_7]PJB34571.1 MAG: hypothetical protein CO108_28020 [Deltaproteobacteria bacterium CG_4_9_14_3_um_filter_63_12]